MTSYSDQSLHLSHFRFFMTCLKVVLFLPCFITYPSLNTKSCIKRLLVVCDFCFWAVWAARPDHKEKLAGLLWATFEGIFFSCFQGQKIFFWKHYMFSALKSCIIPFFLKCFWPQKREKTNLLELHNSSNLNVKVIYSENATNFRKISTLLLTGTT